MIYEMRTYTTKPGALNAWLKAFEQDRLPILKRNLGQLVAAFTPETGELNQIIHIWAYEDYADREKRRAALWSDPDWLDPTKNTSDKLVRQESVLMKPASFSPIQ